MTPPVRASAGPFEARMNRLLAIALVIVTVLPILIFATDFTNRAPLRAARAAAGRSRGPREMQDARGPGAERAMREHGDGRAEQSAATPDGRRAQVREQRARRRPTLGRMVQSVAFQLVLLVVIGAAGRRLFALRL